MKVNRDVLQVFLTIPKTEREDFHEIKKKHLMKFTILLTKDKFYVYSHCENTNGNLSFPFLCVLWAKCKIQVGYNSIIFMIG